MNVLVTGGAGFIGSHVAEHCLRLGYDVVVLDDLSGGFSDQVPVGATFIKGSILDRTLISDIFSSHQFRFVYHLAAYAAEGLSHFIRRFNYTNNLIGSVNLINAAVKNTVECFVFTSSIAVYGTNQLPMVETMVPKPEDPYGISKLAVEQDLAAAQEMFDLNYIIFRPHNVYGEHQNIADRYRNVIGIFMNQLMQKQPMTVFGDGTQTRAFSYIDDVAPFIASAVHVPEAYNQVFNIGADTPYSINQLANEVSCALTSQPPEIAYLPSRNEVDHAYACHDKAVRILGARPQTCLKEGIEKMAAWAQTVGARSGQTFDEIEIEKNLPTIWRESPLPIKVGP